MSYTELIKNFSRTRDYMREFFTGGFKTREEYSLKSARSYDDERRRIESWLGDYMSFRQTAAGRQVFLSVDSREIRENPLYTAWKAKSFTDRDLVLYFCLMDILREEPDLTAAELLDRISSRCDVEPDLSTVRKKLKELEGLGILESEKQGNRLLYRLSDQAGLDRLLERDLPEALAFFSEEAPLGVLGAFLMDRQTGNAVGPGEGPGPRAYTGRFTHKHHYILDALDSEILEMLLEAIREHRNVAFTAVSRRGRSFAGRIFPLRIFVSTRQGRRHLLGLDPETGEFQTLRVDALQELQLLGPDPAWETYEQRFRDFRKYLWGISFSRRLRIRHVEMDIRVLPGEEYLIGRLRREARCGQVLQVDETTWRYAADVYDTREMLPWVRTFTGRIRRLASSDGSLEEKFYEDLGAMVRLYGIEGGDGDDLS